jgi:hypothetical protein
VKAAGPRETCAAPYQHVCSATSLTLSDQGLAPRSARALRRQSRLRVTESLLVVLRAVTDAVMRITVPFEAVRGWDPSCPAERRSTAVRRRRGLQRAVAPSFGPRPPRGDHGPGRVRQRLSRDPLLRSRAGCP